MNFANSANWGWTILFHDFIFWEFVLMVYPIGFAGRGDTSPMNLKDVSPLVHLRMCRLLRCVWAVFPPKFPISHARLSPHFREEGYFPRLSKVHDCSTRWMLLNMQARAGLIVRSALISVINKQMIEFTKEFITEKYLPCWFFKDRLFRFHLTNFTVHLDRFHKIPHCL
jgi:hypothetical protein